MSHKQITALTLTLISTVLTAGCGRGDKLPLVDVSGTVTLNGQPLEDATVVFYPIAGGRPSVGQTDESGFYDLKYVENQTGALAGRHKVSISTLIEPDSDSSDPQLLAGRPEKLPATYNLQTMLQAELNPGSAQILNFSLESSDDLETAHASR